MGNLATVVESEDRYPEAERMQRGVLERVSRALGPDHPLTALALYNIGDVLHEEHRYSEAAVYLRKTVEIQRRVLGIAHPDTIDSAYKLACVLALTHHSDESIALLTDAVNHGLDAKTLAGLETDADLKSLHGDPGFEALLTKAKSRAAAPTLETK
jgi:hypothetical protein